MTTAAAKKSKGINKAVENYRETLSPETLAAQEDLRLYMDKFFDFHANGFPEENLLPELEDSLHEATSLGCKCLNSKYLIELFYMPQMNGRYNRIYKFKKLLIRDTIKAGNIHQALGLTERPYRLELLMEHQHAMPHKDFWEALRWVWTDSENLWQYGDLSELVESQRPGRAAMMEAGEKKLLASLPDSFRIYRGHGDDNRDGWSWTLSSSKAFWFGNRFRDKPTKTFAGLWEGCPVAKAIVSKSDVAFYLAGRGEYEIVVNPDKIRNVTEWLGDREPPRKKFMAVGELCRSRFKLGGGSDHGPAHWANVWRIGRHVSAFTKGSDPDVVELFALIHDHCRENETDDPGHGPRAAAEVDGLLADVGIELTADQLKKLKYAMKKHDRGEVSTDPTIGACWDSDRLDLIRVGIVPVAKYLSTAFAKGRIVHV